VTALPPSTAQPGHELPPLQIDAVDPEKMKLMAAILRDPNPIHFDAERVKELGLGDRVVNQGPATMSYLLNMVTRWSGGIGTLRSAEMRFLGNVFGGDRVSCRGTVVEVGPGTVTVDVEATVEDRTVLKGTIVVAA
jgi:acyl dehydratase